MGLVIILAVAYFLFRGPRPVSMQERDRQGEEALGPVQTTAGALQAALADDSDRGSPAWEVEVFMAAVKLKTAVARAQILTEKPPAQPTPDRLAAWAQVRAFLESYGRAAQAAEGEDFEGAVKHLLAGNTEWNSAMDAIDEIVARRR